MIHLQGNNRPVTHELDSLAIEVVGEMPEDLVGTYYRNGPNPRSGWSPHLYAGDGMIHAVNLPTGAYRNRYVRTPLLLDPNTPRDGELVTTANTHIIDCEDRLLALEEGGLPYDVTTGLDTVGPFRFDGTLSGPMTAHPKRCPVTNELLFFGYSIRPPHLVYHRWDRTRLHSQPIDLPCCSMMHDFAITETRVVFFDSPFIFDGSPWQWSEAHGARVGVMARAGGDVRWFDVELGHLSHSANAYDEGDAVVLTGTRLDGPEALPVLHEWRIDPSSGAITERALDDISTEYPRVPDSLVGRAHRFTYTSSFFFLAEPDHGEINKYAGDTRRAHVLPAGHTCGEPVFVQRSDAHDEDDGYLLSLAHDRSTDRSYLLILDAASLTMVAQVHLPVRVPGGFHGSWISAERR